MDVWIPKEKVITLKAIRMNCLLGLPVNSIPNDLRRIVAKYKVGSWLQNTDKIDLLPSHPTGVSSSFIGNPRK